MSKKDKKNKKLKQELLDVITEMREMQARWIARELLERTVVAPSGESPAASSEEALLEELRLYAEIGAQKARADRAKALDERDAGGNDVAEGHLLAYTDIIIWAEQRLRERR